MGVEVKRAFWMLASEVSNSRDSASSSLPLFIACNPREKEPWSVFSATSLYGCSALWWRIGEERANEEEGRLFDYLSIDGDIPQACDLPRLY